MKKKLLIAGAVLAVVLVALVALVVPFRVDILNDGGTKDYQALTYRVVTWKRISPDEIYEKTRVYFGGDVFQDIDQLWAREEPYVEHQLVARISDYMPDSFLAEPLKWEWQSTVSPCISVQFSSADLEKLGVSTVICTDISRDGAMEGTNRGLYRELSQKYKIQLIASGGVSSIDDVKALKAMDLHGAIIGKAYYTGAIDLKEALEVCR